MIHRTLKQDSQCVCEQRELSVVVTGLLHKDYTIGSVMHQMHVLLFVHT